MSRRFGWTGTRPVIVHCTLCFSILPLCSVSLPYFRICLLLSISWGWDTLYKVKNCTFRVAYLDFSYVLLWGSGMLTVFANLNWRGFLLCMLAEWCLFVYHCYENTFQFKNHFRI